MKVLFLISHPAHFWMYRYVIKQLEEDGNEVVIVIRPKDVLVQLCDNVGLNYIKIKERPKRWGMLGLAISLIAKTIEICRIIHKVHPDILLASDGVIAWAGRIFNIPAFENSEDDAEAISLYASLYYPFYTGIMSPNCCSAWRWEKKKIGYPSYHELGYLHPNQFVPNKAICEKYGINPNEPFFVIRFAKLTAHHDVGIHGLNTEVTQHVIDLLKTYGRIYITSERELESQFEPYRIKINPLDMHHVMAFASLYIGDSQTMAAEAGVMGTPFVRLNDFVGRLSYLHELEAPTDFTPHVDGFVPIIDKHVPDNIHYSLGYGHKSKDIDGFYQSIEHWLTMPNRKEVCALRREKMLSEKIDYAKFLTWFIENYPSSAKEAKGRSADDVFWKQFK